MDVKFENTTTLTKKLFLEAMGARFKVTRKKYRAYCMVVFILGILAALFWFIAASVVGTALIGGFLLSLASVFPLFCFFRGYLIRANKAYQSVMALNPSGQTTYLFYEDRFESVTPLSRHSTDNAMVTRYTQTRRAFVLLFGEEYMVIEKAGFTMGRPDKFVGFLYIKCPKLSR